MYIFVIVNLNIMKIGIIFSVEEFVIYDGLGIWIMIFFKGCFLCCVWCYNFEGILL